MDDVVREHCLAVLSDPAEDPLAPFDASRQLAGVRALAGCAPQHQRAAVGVHELHVDVVVAEALVQQLRNARQQLIDRRERARLRRDVGDGGRGQVHRRELLRASLRLLVEPPILGGALFDALFAVHVEPAQGRGHRVELLGKTAQLAVDVRIDRCVEVAARKTPRAARQFPDWTEHTPHRDEHEHARQQAARDQQPEQQPRGVAQRADDPRPAFLSHHAPAGAGTGANPDTTSSPAGSSLIFAPCAPAMTCATGLKRLRLSPTRRASG